VSVSDHLPTSPGNAYRREDEVNVVRRESHSDEASVGAQVAALARRYSRRANAYDRLWSPVIKPFGERLIAALPLASASEVLDVGTGTGTLLPVIARAAPRATVLGIDNAEGMLELARRKHSGPLQLMSAEHLDLPDDRFDVAILAFVLFHVPDPKCALAEVHRVLKSGGSVGTVTWGVERFPAVNAVWDEELTRAGAGTFLLSDVDSLAECDTESKMTQLLRGAGFASIRTWTSHLTHRWDPDAHLEYHLHSGSQTRLESLDVSARETCLQRVRRRLVNARRDDYMYEGDVITATAVKPAHAEAREREIVDARPA
jgi:ubiquinone/menaquinone biosynthesis C-methylase UbiE